MVGAAMREITELSEDGYSSSFLGEDQTTAAAAATVDQFVLSTPWVRNYENIVPTGWDDGTEAPVNNWPEMTPAIPTWDVIIDEISDEGDRPDNAVNNRPVIQEEQVYSNGSSIEQDNGEDEEYDYYDEDSEEQYVEIGSSRISPFELNFSSSFHLAKIDAANSDKWLVANMCGFWERKTGHEALDWNVWSYEFLEKIPQDKFLFLNVDPDTEHGCKVCSFYRISSFPAIIVIDPVTGQMVRGWKDETTGLDDVLEGLNHFASMTPREYLFGGSALGSDDKETAETSESSNEIQYPVLPEEPAQCAGAAAICRVKIRLPDGRSVQRRFWEDDSTELLWSFCSSEMEEGKRRRFCFISFVPKRSLRLDYEKKLTFKEAGASNSHLTMIWESE